MSSWTLGELAEALPARLEGDPHWPVQALSAPEQASSADLVVLLEPRWRARVAASQAGALLLPEGIEAEGLPLQRLWSVQPRQAFARLLELFYPEPPVQHQIHPSASIDPRAALQAPVEIGAGCVIGPDVQIGAGSRLGPHCVIEAGAQLGQQVQLQARVVIGARCLLGDRVRIQSGSVIGSDGYGYFLHDGAQRRIPQVGRVCIGDDVEIGANVTVDRGTLGDTVIGRGSKIDNLVQIGHNVRIGQHCLLVAQVGIAGSSEVGDYVTLAGQTGVAGHLVIGDHVTAAGKSGITRDIPSGQMISGFPAQPHRDELRLQAALRRVPELLRRKVNSNEDLPPLSPSP
ncbi:MAG: UDP-3-O-(3-hydroxymyristoyl)glucosamine N-acyltransferase [Candidatus Sericytochromatia bacterium]